jgi:hypothetical protein
MRHAALTKVTQYESPEKNFDQSATILACIQKVPAADS